jgi:integrase
VAADLDRFISAAADLGFTERVRSATGSQVPARLLIQTGRRLQDLTLDDLAEFVVACRDRQQRTGKDHRHYLSAVSNTQRVLFHLGVVDQLPRSGGPVPFAERLAQVRPPIRASMIAYLERKRATCQPKTVSAVATRLTHFGVFLADVDPELESVAALDRRRHIEPYLTSLVDAVNSKTGELITVADRTRRVLALAGFLTDITDWGWPEAPPRKLVFRDDYPKLPQTLPRYLPVDVDRRLTEALTHRPDNALAAAALRLQRTCGLRIGELLDLELDCVHEIAEHGSWLKVPLGKLDSERMVPIDAEILELVDHIIDLRSHGRPMPHPRYRRPAQFLFTHHGRRMSQNAVRAELDRAAHLAGLDHITPHQLRHTYATAMVNAGVSLQSLMALLGHVGRDEPALRAAVRQHRPSRVRTSPRPGQTAGPHTGHRPGWPAAVRHHRRPRLERHTIAEIPDGRRVLPARTRPRRLHLRQHLRALPQLSSRTQLAAHPGRAARRRPSARP